MTEEIDAIIFDAGGTLIDMVPSRQEIVSKVLAEQGHKVSPRSLAKAMVKADRALDEDFGMVDGKEESWFWEKYDSILLEELGIEEDSGKYVKAFHERFRELTPKVGSWAAYPDSKPILRGLKKRDFTIGMISNATELLRRVLDNLDLARYFEFVIISDEVGVRKPSPKIFQMAVKAAKTSPNRALYVGDKLAVDYLGARRAGLHAVLVDRENVFPDAKCIRARDLNFFKRYF